MNSIIKSVVFDLDGTLYPEQNINFLLFFEFIKNIRFFLAFRKVRKEIRVLQEGIEKPSNRDEFLLLQTGMLAEYLKISQNNALSLMNKIFYGDIFQNKFKKLIPYDGVLDLIYSLKEKGIKIGIMSDFPILNRTKYLLDVEDDFWDVLYSSEDTGYLKPNKMAFLEIINKLNIDSENVLYVGNSYKYDVLGAKNISMKTAYISDKKENLNIRPDFVFSDYKELKKYIFSNM